MKYVTKRLLVDIEAWFIIKSLNKKDDACHHGNGRGRSRRGKCAICAETYERKGQKHFDDAHDAAVNQKIVFRRSKRNKDTIGEQVDRGERDERDENDRIINIFMDDTEAWRDVRNYEHVCYAYRDRCQNGKKEARVDLIVPIF